MASIQSTLVPLELSFNGGITWQILVCLTQHNMPLEKTTNVTETFCGTETGLGSLTFNPSFTAVVKTDVASNQVTYDRMLVAMVNEELIRFRVQAPTAGSVGVYFYLSGTAYVTSLDLTLAVGETVQFTGTLTGTGTLDITP
jgi:hypothetical protein